MVYSFCTLQIKLLLFIMSERVDQLVATSSVKKRGPELSEDTRRDIINLHGKGGLTYAEIAKLLSLSPNTVGATIRRWKNDGLLATRSRPGRPSKLSGRVRRIIKRAVDKEPSISAVKISDMLARDHGLQVCKETIRLSIHRFGYKSFFRRKKPHISKKNRKDRIEYAKKYINEPPEFWNKVLFTDESKFNIFGFDGRLRVWRPPREGLNPKYTMKTVKHGGGGVMVWGCMSANGVGKLKFIDGTMDHRMYIDILKENLRPSTDQLGISGDFIFQQDNDPKHMATNSKLFLLYNTPRVMKSPAQSPDLNPIEHLWDHLERRIREHHITNKENLKAALAEEWEKIGPEITVKLVSSMKSRLGEVLRMRGYATRY